MVHWSRPKVRMYTRMWGERFKEGNNKGKGKLGMEDMCNLVPLDHFRDDRVHEMGCGGIARSFIRYT